MNATTATTEVKVNEVTPVTAKTESTTPKPAPPKVPTSNHKRPPRTPAGSTPASTVSTVKAPAPTLVLPTTPTSKVEPTAAHKKAGKVLEEGARNLRALHNEIDRLDGVTTKKLNDATVQHKRLAALFNEGREISNKDLSGYLVDVLNLVQDYVDAKVAEAKAEAIDYTNIRVAETDNRVAALHQATGSTFARFVIEINKRLAGPRFLWLALLAGVVVGLIAGIWFTPSGMSSILFGVAIGAISAGIMHIVMGSIGNKISPIDPTSITEPSSARTDNHTLAAGTHADSPN